MRKVLRILLVALVGVALAGISPAFAEDCPKSLKVEVDFGRSDAQLVRDGDYANVSDLVEPDTEYRDLLAGVVPLKLLRWGESMYTEQVFAELGRRDLRPATIKEVLSIGRRYRKVLVGCESIVALGTTYDSDDGEVVPYISVDAESGERYLRAQHQDLEWDKRRVFAAVDRKYEFAEPPKHSPFLPHFEITGGVMLPGFYTQDTSGGEILPDEGAWGVSLVGGDVTFLRWGRIYFGGVALVWGLRYSGWDGRYDQYDESTDGLTSDLIIASPILFRVSPGRQHLKNAVLKGEWYIYAACGWNFLRASRENAGSQKANWLFGIAYNFGS